MKSREIALNGIRTAVCLERYPVVVPTEAQVRAFEQALGYRLPDDYRAFLLTYNGGSCDMERVVPAIGVCICDLFGLFPDDPDGHLMPLRLPNSPELHELWDELPPGVLPIGETDGGDMIALRFRPDGSSEIAILDHESNALREMLRADTLTELLASTRPFEEDEHEA